MEINNYVTTTLIVFKGYGNSLNESSFMALDILDDPSKANVMKDSVSVRSLANYIRFGFNCPINPDKCTSFGISLYALFTSMGTKYSDTIITLAQYHFSSWKLHFPVLKDKSWDDLNREITGHLDLKSYSNRVCDHSKLNGIWDYPVSYKSEEWQVGNAPYVQLGSMSVNKKLWRDFIQKVTSYFCVPKMNVPLATVIQVAPEYVKIQVKGLYKNGNIKCSTVVSITSNLWSGIAYCIGVYAEKMGLLGGKMEVLKKVD